MFIQKDTNKLLQHRPPLARIPVAEHNNAKKYQAVNAEAASETYVGEENRAFVRLWAAVILQAVTDYSKYRIAQEYGSSKRSDLKGIEIKRGKEAMLWIFDTSTDAPRTFNWACQILKHDPDVARTIIKRDWKVLGKIKACDSTSYELDVSDEDIIAHSVPPTRQTNYRKPSNDNRKNTKTETAVHVVG